MKYTIAFICIGNSCRSQMAEGLAKHYYGNIFDVYSAGTNPENKISENAVLVLKEDNIDISNNKPKHLSEIPFEFDIVITMGCGVECPTVLSKYKEDFGIKDPFGKPIDEFRNAKNEIKEKLDFFVINFLKTI